MKVINLWSLVSILTLALDFFSSFLAPLYIIECFANQALTFNSWLHLKNQSMYLIKYRLFLMITARSYDLCRNLRPWWELILDSWDPCHPWEKGKIKSIFVTIWHLKFKYMTICVNMFLFYLGKIVKKNDTKFRVKCIGINPFVLNTLTFASYDLV